MISRLSLPAGGAASLRARVIAVCRVTGLGLIAMVLAGCGGGGKAASSPAKDAAAMSPVQESRCENQVRQDQVSGTLAAFTFLDACPTVGVLNVALEKYVAHAGASQQQFSRAFDRQLSVSCSTLRPIPAVCAQLENMINGTAVELADPNGDLTSISCPSASSCVAVDGDGNALIYNGDSWAKPVAVDADGGNYGLVSLSCPSAGFCAAIDSSGNAVTYNDARWTEPAAVDSNDGPTGLASVSCVSSSFCVAVGSGGDALTYNGSAWTKPDSIDTSSTGVFVSLKSVSCASALFCMAVDELGDALTYNGSSWTKPASVDPLNNPDVPGAHPSGLTSVSCPSATFCAAVDHNGNAYIFDGKSWAAPVLIDAKPGFNGLTSVSCPSSSFCATVDSNGYRLTYNGSGWTAPVALDTSLEASTPNSDPSLVTASVSCPAAYSCSAVDTNGNAVRLGSGVAS
jgi:hypothetical protein